MGGDAGYKPRRCDLVRVRNFDFQKNTGSLSCEPNRLIKRPVVDKRKELRLFYAHRSVLSDEPLRGELLVSVNGFLLMRSEHEKLTALAHTNEWCAALLVGVGPVFELNAEAVQTQAEPSTGRCKLQCMVSREPWSGAARLWFSKACGCAWSLQESSFDINRLLCCGDEELLCPVCDERSRLAELLPAVPCAAQVALRQWLKNYSEQLFAFKKLLRKQREFNLPSV